MRILLVYSLFLIAPLPALSQESAAPKYNPSGPEQVTLQSGALYLDGKPWTPKGVVITGRLTPPKRMHQSFVGQSLRDAAADFGPDTLKAVRAFGANLVRFSLSQGGLDPSDPIYDPEYLSYAVSAVKLTRSLGFPTVVAVVSQPGSGSLKESNMPGAGTIAAWKQLAGQLCGAGDNGLIFNLFLEPDGGGGSPSANDWKAWQGGFNGVIAALRKAGCNNLFIVEGLTAGKQFNGSYPLTDLKSNFIWGIHVYFNCGQCRGKSLSTPAQWDSYFGNWCASNGIPCTLAEWGLGSGPMGGSHTTGCFGKAPMVTESFFRYLRDHSSTILGLTGWAFDSENQIMEGHSLTTPTNFAHFSSCPKTPVPFGFGRMLSSYFKR